MSFGFILLLELVCAICRYVIFKKRDIRGRNAFVPWYNKYLLGKSIGQERLGKIVASAILVTKLFFALCFGYELWIIQNYAQVVQIPHDGVTDSQIEVLVPDDIAQISVYSKYVLLAFAFVTVVLWSMLMWKFTMAHKRNPWWIVLWTVIPTISYIAFAVSPEAVINGKRYTTKRVEIDESANDDASDKQTVSYKPHITHTRNKKFRKKR